MLFHKYVFILVKHFFVCLYHIRPCILCAKISTQVALVLGGGAGDLKGFLISGGLCNLFEYEYVVRVAQAILSGLHRQYARFIEHNANLSPIPCMVLLHCQYHECTDDTRLNKIKNNK